MAVLSVGAIFTSTNPLNMASEIAHQVRDSKACLAFATPDLASKLSMSTVVVGDDGANGRFIASLRDLIARWNPEDAPVVKLRQDDVATLLYSSGLYVGRRELLSSEVIDDHRTEFTIGAARHARLHLTVSLDIEKNYQIVAWPAKTH